MMDGQIHDIKKVSSTILEVKKELEKEIGRPLKDVCIAAAGRVLRTITTHVETDFQEDKTITMDDVVELFHIYRLLYLLFPVQRYENFS